MAKLTIHDKGKPRLYEILEPSVYLGKSQESHVRLRDPAVAGVHCQIRRTRDGYKLVDLESKTGTKVNGRFVNQQILEDGDEIELGSTRILFEQEEAPVFEGSATRRRLERDEGFFSRIPPWGMAVLAGSAALLLAAILLLILSTGGPPPGAREAMRADTLFSEGRYDEALEVIREARAKGDVDPAFEKEFQRVEQAIAGQKESTVKIAEAIRYEDTANEVIRFANAEENKKAIAMKEEVLSRFEEWFKKYPDAPEYLKDYMEEARKVALRNFEILGDSAQKRNNW